MNEIEKIERLMKAHGIDGLYMGGAATSSVCETETEFVLEFGDLPQLTFFIQLAELCGVPIESIRQFSSDGGAGCDTCGYGAGTEITVVVPKGS